MTQKNVQLYFFAFFAAIAVALVVLIFKPFFTVLALAAIFAVIVYPVHRFILNHTGGYKNLSAGITTILLVILVLAPLSIFTFLLFQQSVELLRQLTSQSGLLQTLSGTVDGLQNFISSHFNISIDLHQYFNVQTVARQGLSWSLNQLQSLFANTIAIVINIFLFVVAFFFFLRDGKDFIKDIVRLSPLKDSYDEKVLHTVAVSINSVIRGSLIVAIIKGVLAGLGFYLFGVPGVLVLSFLSVIVALVPNIGAPVLFFPFAAYGFFTHGWLWALGLMLWSVVLLAGIDNFVAPVIMKQGTKIHTLLIMFSLLGGLVVFGPVGFIIGPAILSFLYGLAEIYPLLIKKRS